MGSIHALMRPTPDHSPTGKLPKTAARGGAETEEKIYMQFLKPATPVARDWHGRDHKALTKVMEPSIGPRHYR